MRQILQNLKTGKTELLEVPAPSIEPGHILIRSHISLVSRGTEKMLVQFGRAGLVGKARAQPEKVRMVIDKIRTDGLFPTMEAVLRRLDEPLALGYCNAGEVLEIGEGVKGFRVGDRVASNGPHAEIVSVPGNLCSRIPDNVSYEEGAFTVVSAIALEGIRLAAPSLGETVAVVGLGLLGLLSVQLLRANGCKVLGYDFNGTNVELGRQYGAEAVQVGNDGDPVRHAMALTDGVGVDAVIIAATTRDNSVISQSAKMCRKRGRIVLVGVVGLEINRADFYEKELTFQVSCSYGPGRHEQAYEQGGMDYPLAFVRWTANRNFGSILNAMGSGALSVKALITRKVPLDRFREIYGDIDTPGIAALLEYPGDHALSHTILANARTFAPSPGTLGIIGAGNFTKMTLLPALSKARAPVKYLASASGVSSTHLAKKYGIPYSTTDTAILFGDREVVGVLVATQHHLHARQVIAALEAGKHVLVEKPLCLTTVDLRAIEGALTARPDATLTVGFNRRFSVYARKMRSLLDSTPGPLSLNATMNAGPLPANHWVNDPTRGGGRLIGEACHLVDFAVYLTGSLITRVCAMAVAGGGTSAGESASMLLQHANGSTSTINYFSNGHRSFPKERVQVFGQGRILVLDDFRHLTGFGFKNFSSLKGRLDKGHEDQFAEFALRARTGGMALIPWAEVANVTKATIAIGDSLKTNAWVRITA